ncbi:MAG: hypothetical protein PHH37_15475 [Paludibacter sp.]|nr:hypothetical protein [Paludibacter sp.]
MSKKTFQSLFTAGAFVTFIGAMIQLFNLSFAAYVFSVGSLTLILLQFFVVLKNTTENKAEQRLHRIGLLSSLLLALAAYFMFKGSNSWVVAVLIYALINLYLSFRIKS